LWICSALAFAGATTLIGPAVAQTASSGQSSGIAYSIQLQATIDPATQKWISSALDDAASENAKIAIIRLDTPGGLSDSMRSIIEDMGSAPMPVVVYVSPSNARAGSAGAYITEAADVAAMYPISNIGSATPIAIGPSGASSDLDRKIKNDAAASMRALAAAHGRNPKLAQLLVTQAKNVTAKEALHAGLIDLISPTQEALLRQLNGFHVKGPKAQTLHTAGLQIENHDMPLQYQVLEILVNPNVAYLLILIGLVGMVIELFSPGLIVPGTIGVISFLLGLYGTAQLPVTAVGVLLLVFGVAMIIAEAHLPTHGILGASGVAALIASGLVLYDTNNSAFEISPVVVILTGLLMGGFLALAVQRALRARRLPRRTGWEEMVGAVGEVRDPLDPIGQIFVEGALWRAELAPAHDGSGNAAAEPAGDGRPIERGSRVRVESVDGLTLRVRPLESDPDAVADPAAAT
jgi:membrane-bound serine protease (ClpP class)